MPTNTCRLTDAVAADGGTDAPIGDAPPSPPDAPGHDARTADAPRPDARPPDAPPGPARLALAPPSLDFGSVTLGDMSLPLTFTVTNSGGSPSATLTPMLSDAQSYALSGGTCSGAVAADTSCTILVVFQPSGAAGPVSAMLTVGGLTATLTGTALVPGKLTIAPTSHAFGSVALGSTSAETVFMVQNTGRSRPGRCPPSSPTRTTSSSRRTTARRPSTRTRPAPSA